VRDGAAPPGHPRGDARARWNLFAPRQAVRALAPVSGNLRVNAPTQAPLRATHATLAAAHDPVPFR